MNENLVAAAKAAGVWLHARGWRLATAESCTGGLVAAAITEIAGSSAWFDRSLVTYTDQSKQELLGVGADTLAQFGAVSEQTVSEMARGLLMRCPADAAIAISGIAGPSGGTAAKPVGTVCLAWAYREGTSVDLSVTTAHFSGDRAAVREAACLLALRNLIKRA